MNFQKLPVLRSLPAEGARTLSSAAAMVGAAWGWGSGAVHPVVAAPILLAGAGGLIVALGRQASAEQLAGRLCGGEQGSRLPLSRTLPQLAAKLGAVEHRLASVSPVTGLPTREHLFKEIAVDIAADRGPHLLGAVRFADFDRLAAFDDAAAGSALRQFALRLSAASKTHHVIAQVDRDCFAVWFRGGGGLEAAAAEFRAIVYVAGQDIVESGDVLTPNIDVGAVSFPRDGVDGTHLLRRATAALSRPEISANGDVKLANPPSIEVARGRFRLEQDLAQAIAQEQLTVVFQPVVDLSVGRMIGAEALLRWDHPALGPVSPAQFIPVIESSGMSERYGLWVLNAACREARRWRDEGLGDLKVAVNVSARQLSDPGLQTKITRTLDRYGLPAQALELELTETAAMADAARTRTLFGELRAMGVSLAIDDFGTGYSSLSYLKNLPFDKLKIDREFVTDVDAKRDSRAICKALIELGRGLDLVVLAEGVESARELAALRELGCDVFQGYYFSKPLSAEDYRRLALDRAWATRLGAAYREPAAAPRERGLNQSRPNIALRRS